MTKGPTRGQSSVGLAGGYHFILQGKALSSSSSLLGIGDGDQMDGMDLVINLLLDLVINLL